MSGNQVGRRTPDKAKKILKYKLSTILQFWKIVDASIGKQLSANTKFSSTDVQCKLAFLVFPLPNTRI